MISNKRFLDTIELELLEETGIHNCYSKYVKYLTLDDIFTTDAVYMASCHCASGFRDRNDTNAFMSHAWLNSKRLADEVKNHTFKPSYYKAKQITERGKPRTIRPPKFECKVVQKVLCDYMLRAVLEPKMISTSYAGIRGKGTDKMFADILKALNKAGKGCEILLCDYKGYFASIDTNLICQTFLRWGMDKDVVRLFHFFDPEGIGLSLGNEASQVPASWFASTVDHRLKDGNGFKNVFRFMDDTIVLTDGDNETKKCLKIIEEETAKLHLKLKTEKIKTVPWGNEFKFCKERFLFNKKDGIYYRIQNPKPVNTELRKIKRFEIKIKNREMTRHEAWTQINAVIKSLEKHPNNYRGVKRIYDEMNLAGIFA